MSEINITPLIEAIDRIKWLTIDLEEQRDNVEEIFNNMPELLQVTVQGQDIEAGVDSLYEAISFLEEVIKKINRAIKS